MNETLQTVETKALNAVVPSVPTWKRQEKPPSTKREQTEPSNAAADATESTGTSTSTSSPLHTTQSTFPELHFTYNRIFIFLYALFLLTCNLIIPCILFYPLVSLTKLTPKEVIGISSAALGISSCFDSPIRLYRLARHRKTYGPLGDDTWWYLDFTMWTYTVALLVFAIPLAIAPAIPLFNFFLMSTVMLVGPVVFVFFISLFRPKLPIRCSSDAPGERMKPAAFYVIEDVASVDFMHGRAFRRALHNRWQKSLPFQQLMMHLTLYWTISGLIYCGVTAAVSWTTPLNFAFAWTLGQLFVWARITALGCRFLVKAGLKKERIWWDKQHPNETQVDQPRNEV